MPKENPEGPTSIKVDNIPSDVRKKMWLLKRINAIIGGPTDYKKMIIEALRRWVDSPENAAKLRMAEEIAKAERKTVSELVRDLIDKGLHGQNAQAAQCYDYAARQVINIIKEILQLFYTMEGRADQG